MTNTESTQPATLDPAQRRLLETLSRPTPSNDLDHCPACGFDLGTHRPACPSLCPYCEAAPEHATTHASGEHKTIHPDAIANITNTIHHAPSVEYWNTYTDEQGDTYTTNSEY